MRMREESWGWALGLGVLVLLVAGLLFVARAETGTPLGNLKPGDRVAKGTDADAAEAAAKAHADTVAATVQSNTLAAVVAATNAPGMIRAVEIEPGYYRFYVIGSAE